MATVRDLVRIAARAAEERKGKDVRVLDVRGLSSVTDYMVVCTGSSDTNVRAIAENIREKLGEKGDRPFSVEGIQEGSWVLLDYVDYVVHVFLGETRAFYGMEELWADAKTVPVPEAGAKPAAKKASAEAPAKAPARAPARKEALPAVPRVPVKPKKSGASAVPKRKAAAKAPAPKKARVPKKKTEG